MKQRILPLVALLMTGCNATINNPVINADTQVSQQTGTPVATAAQSGPQTVIVNQQINIIQQNQQNNVSVNGPVPGQTTSTPPPSLSMMPLDAGYLRLDYPSSWSMQSLAPETDINKQLMYFQRYDGAGIGVYQVKRGGSASDAANAFASSFMGSQRLTAQIGGREAQGVVARDLYKGTPMIMATYFVEAGGILFQFFLTAEDTETGRTAASDLDSIINSVRWGGIPNQSQPVQAVAPVAEALPSPAPTPTPTPEPLPTAVVPIPVLTATPTPASSGGEPVASPRPSIKPIIAAP